MKTKSIFVLLLVSFLFPSVGFSADVTLAWAPIDIDNLAGYRVYVRETTEGYDYNHPEAEVEDTQCTLTGFDAYEAYYFIVRAVDADGTETSDSNEVYWDPTGTSTGGNTSISLGGDANSEASSSGCFISTLMGE